MKIKKLQQGGIVYTPFIPNTAGVQQSGSESSEGPEKISGTFTKEIIDVLKENGIPNDVESFLSEANTFLDRSKSLSSLSLFGGDNDDYDLTDIVRLQALANKVRFNKELYETAAGQLSKERSWSEVALDDKGRMYVYSDDEGIQTIDPNEYYKNRDAYVALTNSQLLDLRESQPYLSFNQNILNNITNSVGTESIVNYVKSIIKDFGTTTVEGYTAKDRDKIEEGFRNLLMGGPDGYYKVTMKDQGTELALKYIVNSLPANMIQTLRAKTAAEGGDPNSSDIYNLLALALGEHTSSTRAASFDKTATDSAIEAGVKSGDLTTTDYLETFAYGRVSQGEWINLGTADQKNLIQAYAQFYGTPIDKTGKQVSRTNLENLLDQAEFGKIVDRNSVYFGDQKIDDLDVRKVLWDGTSQLTRVLLPYELQSDGTYKPNLQSQERFEEFQQWIDDNPYLTPLQKNQKAREEFGLDIEYDANTDTFKWKQDRVLPFAVLNGYTSSGVVDIDKESPWVTKVTDSKRKELTDLYDNYVNYGDPYPTKSKKPADKVKSRRWNLYQAPIFIPITDVLVSTALNNNEYVTKDTYIDVAQQAEAKRNRQQIRTTFN